jgi:hypothetical protein
MVFATVLVAGTAVIATGALASAKSFTVGDPQPELALFNVGATGGGTGSGVVLPDGNLVLVSPAENGHTAVVCMLHPGDTKCASKAILHAYKGGGNQDGFGDAEVLSTGGTDVSVVLEDCCYIPSPHGGGAVVFNSANDGQTFSAETPAGILQGVSTATFADGEIVAASSETGSLNVQAFPPNPASPVMTPVANPNGREDGDTSLTTYRGGVLVASDDTNGNTLVEYAPSGTNFNLKSSYGSVGVFRGENLAAVSGNALLTYAASSITHGAFIRFFNGTSFGPRYSVPEPSTGDDGYWSLQEVGALAASRPQPGSARHGTLQAEGAGGGVAHVFFLNRRNGYDIYSETTSNGVRWSPLAIYNTAITAGALMPVLGRSGAGLVYETDSKPLLAQPILNGQSVVVKLAKARVYVGTATSLSGQAKPILAGQAVVLEQLSAGRWYNVSSSHESSTGTFSFSVPGTTETYRAVVAYQPGYYLYGYSNFVTLTAIPKPAGG